MTNNCYDSIVSYYYAVLYYNKYLIRPLYQNNYRQRIEYII